MTKWKRVESGVYEAYIGDWYVEVFGWDGTWNASAIVYIGSVRHSHCIGTYATAKEAKHAIAEAVRKLSAQDEEKKA